MFVKKEMIAMLLAGGQGSRLGILTSDVAKPAVSFGGKYRIIDFPLSNCINSGIDTVGVLTQYMPLRLNSHVGIGIPWDLDKNVGGVSILSPYEKIQNTEWYTGTANAIYQNLSYMESFNPDYVLILSGDHIYKMDYEAMLESHKENGADVTIAVMPVSMEEASRFGIMITDENGRITDFEEKPAHPRSNLASMGIYIFNWDTLKEALIANRASWRRSNLGALGQRSISLRLGLISCRPIIGRRMSLAAAPVWWWEPRTISAWVSCAISTNGASVCRRRFRLLVLAVMR